MAFAVALLTALCMFLGVMATPSIAVCDFTGWDLDSAVDKMLLKLPEHHVPYVHEFRKVFDGVEVGPFNVTGLNRLARLGPVIPYCAGANRLLHLELLNDGGAFASLPWRACTGQEGVLKIAASISRFTAEFRIQSGVSREDVKLEYAGPILALSTENPAITIHGAGKMVTVATEVLSTLFPAVTHRVWNDYFYPYARGALRQAVRDAFEGGVLR